MPTYHLTIFPLAKWAQKKLDRIRRSFLWKGKDDANRGHCLVNWQRVCRPTHLGGLGILNLDKFGRALRLRWMWHSWNSPSKPWVGTPTPCDVTDQRLFAACSTIHLGDGKTACFWLDA